MGLPDSQKVF